MKTKILLSIVFIVLLSSCQQKEPDPLYGCFYGYPSDGDPFEILGCGTKQEFENFQLPAGYSNVEYSPIGNCAECERRNTRGGG